MVEEREEKKQEKVYKPTIELEPGEECHTKIAKATELAYHLKLIGHPNIKDFVEMALKLGFMYIDQKLTERMGYRFGTDAC